MIDTIKEAIKDQIDANETMVKTINKIVNNMNTQRELIEMQDKINRKLIQDIQDIKLELNSNKKRANKKWQA
jgi:non-homologous end joining protein Ku